MEKRLLLKILIILIFFVIFLPLRWLLPDHFPYIYMITFLIMGLGLTSYVFYSYHKGEIQVPWFEGNHKIDKEQNISEFYKYFKIYLITGIAVIILSLIGLIILILILRIN